MSELKIGDRVLIDDVEVVITHVGMRAEVNGWNTKEVGNVSSTVPAALGTDLMGNPRALTFWGSDPESSKWVSVCTQGIMFTRDWELDGKELEPELARDADAALRSEYRLSRKLPGPAELAEAKWTREGETPWDQLPADVRTKLIRDQALGKG